jgi:predicted nucleic acid-binding protein
VILVDTSIWADHFRSANEVLTDLLSKQQVMVHPFVIGEIAMGNLRDRANTLEALSLLPMAVRAEDDEVIALVESEQLYGTGIGLIDAHLLASARLTVGAFLWTKDKRLAQLADRLGVAFR